MITFFDFGAAAPLGAARTITTLGSTITNSSSGTISWPTPSLDELGAYSGGSPTRLTVPSGYGYVKLYACALVSGEGAGVTSELALNINKNGSSVFIGFAGHSTAHGDDYKGRIVETPWLAVSAGDYFTVDYNIASASNDIVAGGAMPTMFMMYGIPTTPDATLVNKTSDQTGLNSTVTISWDAEQYDTNNMWSSGTNLTVPSGFSYAKATAQMHVLNHSISTRGGPRIDKGGVIFSQSVGLYSTAARPWMQSHAGAIPIANTNVLTLSHFSADAAYDVESDNSSFGVELHNRDSCAVTLTSDLTTINAVASDYIISWTSESFDDMAAFDAGSPTRLTSPGGWVQVGGTAAVSNMASGDVHSVVIRHYDSSNTLLNSYYQAGRQGGTLGTHICSTDCITPHINTTAGDYFTFTIRQESDTSITIESESRFWMEVYP